jgi:DNA polymerase III delta subunit-like protein
LDTLSPQPRTKKSQLIAFKLALRDNDTYMCLVMFVRQVRLLIQSKVGADIKGPFFMINKINKQANNFELEQLLNLHSKLYALDAAMKTSQNTLELKTSIEQLIINL